MWFSPRTVVGGMLRPSRPFNYIIFYLFHILFILYIFILIILGGTFHKIPIYINVKLDVNLAA